MEAFSFFMYGALEIPNVGFAVNIINVYCVDDPVPHITSYNDPFPIS